MTFPAYHWKHIATDPLHIKNEPRYAVVRVSDGATVATHEWAQSAKDDARARSIAEGSCTQCGGEGTVITDYISTPDGDLPIGDDCPRCDGSGIEPRGPA